MARRGVDLKKARLLIARHGGFLKRILD